MKRISFRYSRRPGISSRPSAPAERRHSAGTRFLAVLIAAAFTILMALPVPGSAQQRRIFLIRDAETEAWIKLMAYPIFKAAGLNPSSVRVHLIGDNSINAFVAGGQRIFINTGLILKTEYPGEVIGVIAHEAGHIAGGHLARMQRQLAKASTAAIIGMLIGAVAIVGGAASGEINAAKVGQGILAGNPEIVRRGVLAYQRAQEAAADQAAIKYLERTGTSSRGMLTLFQRLANDTIVSLRYADPYVFSHPLPRSRVALMERFAKKSKFFNKKDSPAITFKHELIKGKLHGFLLRPYETLRLYPPTDTSMRARYARAVAHYRSGDVRKSLAEIKHLLKALPNNPYFWELKGQALFETGRVRESIAPLSKAAKLAPRTGLIRVLLAQAMLGTEDPKYTKAAIGHLKTALRYEDQTSLLHRQLAIAYARTGKLGLAQLESAEAAVLEGDLALAKEQATRAKKRLKRGSTHWVKANDILQLRGSKKK